MTGFVSEDSVVDSLTSRETRFLSHDVLRHDSSRIDTNMHLIYLNFYKIFKITQNVKL